MGSIEGEWIILAPNPLSILVGKLSNKLGASFRLYLALQHEEVVDTWDHVPASDAVETSDLLFFELVIGGCESHQKIFILLGVFVAAGVVGEASIVVAGIQAYLADDELDEFHVGFHWKIAQTVAVLLDRLLRYLSELRKVEEIALQSVKEDSAQIQRF